MSYTRRLLERVERENEERMRKRAEEEREWEADDDQVVLAVGMFDQSSQHHCGSQLGRGPNVNKRRHSLDKNLFEDYFFPNSLYPSVDFRGRYRMHPYLFNKIMHDVFNHDTYFIKKYDALRVFNLLPKQKLTASLRLQEYGAFSNQVDEIARMRKSIILERLVRFCDAIKTINMRDYLRKPTTRDLQRLLQKAEARESQNDLNMLDQFPVFNDVLRGHSPQITYQINNIIYLGGYYLADRIYPRRTTCVKTIWHPQSEKEKYFTVYQEGYMKDVERCFGILQARWPIIRGAARMFDEEVLRSIMMTCIIHHNMILEDDYDEPKLFEPYPINTTLTRIYE